MYRINTIKVDFRKIQRSLSMKCCPYDNAVAEAPLKFIKTEFSKVNILQNRVDMFPSFGRSLPLLLSRIKTQVEKLILK